MILQDLDFRFYFTVLFPQQGKSPCKEGGQGCGCQARAWIWVTFLTPMPLCGFWPRQLVCVGCSPNSLVVLCSWGIQGSGGSLNSHASTLVPLGDSAFCALKLYLYPWFAHKEILSSSFLCSLSCPWLSLSILSLFGSCEEGIVFLRWDVLCCFTFLCCLYKLQPGVSSLILNCKNSLFKCSKVYYYLIRTLAPCSQRDETLQEPIESEAQQ